MSDSREDWRMSTQRHKAMRSMLYKLGRNLGTDEDTKTSYYVLDGKVYGVVNTLAFRVTSEGDYFEFLEALRAQKLDLSFDFLVEASCCPVCGLKLIKSDDWSNMYGGSVMESYADCITGHYAYTQVSGAEQVTIRTETDSEYPRFNKTITTEPGKDFGAEVRAVIQEFLES